MAIVILPRSLVVLFPGAGRRVSAEGATVGEVIGVLDERWPGVRDRLCDPGPELRAFINVYVDGLPADLASATSPGCTIHILPAVAGG